MTEQSLSLKSTAFVEGQRIPRRYSEEGSNDSPPLAWSAPPAGTRQFALICDDPDAPTDEPWVHWVIYSISPDARALGQGIAKTALLQEPAGALQGKNSWQDGQTLGYRGPMPPPGHGVHHYYFRLYALDSALELAPGMTKNELLEAMKGHVLAEGVLMGTYER